MNILIDYLASNTGGGKTVAKNQIENLIKYDKNNNYFVLIKKGNDICDNIQSDKLKVIEIDYKNLIHRLFLQFFIFPKYLKEYNIDILFSPNNFTWYYKDDIKKITMYQNVKVFNTNFDNSNLSKMNYSIIRNLTKKSLKVSDKNIFVSNYIKNSNVGIVNYLGIDFKNNFIENKIKNYDISLIVSNFSKHKNLENLLNSMEEYYKKYNKKLKILIIGGDRNIKRFNDYKSKFEKYEYADFEITGLIEKNEVIKRLGKSKLYVSLSLLEAFPLTQFEALQTNIPILLSNIDIYKELCGDYNIYVNPLNSEEIAEKIHWIFENYDEYYKINMNLKDEVIGKFTWENHAKKLIKIFENIVK